MSRFWISGVFIILGIAAAKTFIVARFLLDGPDFVTISGLLALFTGMTTGVAYIAYTQLQKLMLSQRKKRLAPGSHEPVAKETVISRYAPDWGLSRAEADVAIFVAKGFSNSEVADMRGCAVATIKSQLGSIYQKSGLESRYQLISFVTDEVVAMAQEQEEEAAKTTRSILPLRTRRARDEDQMRQQQDLIAAE